MSQQMVDPHEVQFIRLMSELDALDQFRRRVFITKRVHPKYPRFFYKYFSFDPDNETSIRNLKAVVIDSYLWLSSPADFNDPFDFASTMTFGGDRLALRKKITQLVQDNAPELNWKKRHKRVTELMANSNEEVLRKAQASADHHRSSTGIYCLTTDPRNILMWSHYAKDHKGVVIQFELSKDPRVFFEALEVRYSEKYPVRDFLDDSDESFEHVIRNKWSGWAYEKEHRIIHFQSAHKRLPFSSKAVSAVILGCAFKKSAIPVLRRLLDERVAQGRPPIRTFAAERHPTSFKLTIRSASLHV